MLFLWHRGRLCTASPCITSALIIHHDHHRMTHMTHERHVAKPHSAQIMLRKCLFMPFPCLFMSFHGVFPGREAYLLEVLANYGVVADGVDVTPLNADRSRRDLEILQWLNAHRNEAIQYVTVIIIRLVTSNLYSYSYKVITYT